MDFITELERQCSSCGKTIQVKINISTGDIIEGGTYWGKTRFGVGQWCSHQIVTENGETKFVRCIPRYKYLYYLLRDYKRTLFHQYRDVEFWDCPSCNRRSAWRSSEKVQKFLDDLAEGYTVNAKRDLAMAKEFED